MALSAVNPRPTPPCNQPIPDAHLPVPFSASLNAMPSSSVGSERPFWFTLYARRSSVGPTSSPNDDAESDGDKSAEQEGYYVHRIYGLFFKYPPKQQQPKAPVVEVIRREIKQQEKKKQQQQQHVNRYKLCPS